MEKKPCYLLELPKHRFRSIFTSGVCSALIKEHGMNTCSHDIRLSTSEVIRTEYDNARRLTREDDTLMLLISCNFLGTNDGLPPFDEITRFVELPHTLSIIIFPTEEKETEHKEWEYQFLKHLRDRGVRFIYCPPIKNSLFPLLPKYTISNLRGYRFGKCLPKATLNRFRGILKGTCCAFYRLGIGERGQIAYQSRR